MQLDQRISSLHATAKVLIHVHLKFSLSLEDGFHTIFIILRNETTAANFNIFDLRLQLGIYTASNERVLHSETILKISTDPRLYLLKKIVP